MDLKQFEFTGTPGGYFVASIISLVTAYIPIFGWPIGYNYMNTWLADNVLINGRKVKYTATYGEVLKFLVVNILLVIVTLGIYSFWFAIKSYKFMASHTSYADMPAPQAPAMSAPTPVMPAAPAPPAPVM
ncbi:MAG: hypothetical protein JWO47_303 [Candidatus Saccharibacteria bacterium]|nr:hypothetical protein [Candidatus Saccharibacteria bacterium]